MFVMVHAWCLVVGCSCCSCRLCVCCDVHFGDVCLVYALCDSVVCCAGLTVVCIACGSSIVRYSV